MVVKPSLRWKDVPDERSKATKTYAAWNKMKPLLEKSGKKPISMLGAVPVEFGHLNPGIGKYLIEAENSGIYGYSQPKYMLKEAISHFEILNGGPSYSPEDIIPLCGVANCFQITWYSLLENGTEIVTLEPSHTLAGPTSWFAAFGSKVVPVSCEESNNWEPDFEDLRKKISDKTKAILIDHPQNPTGIVYNEKVLKGIIDIAGENDILVISDEVYRSITFDGIKSTSIAKIADDVPSIVFMSLTKFFCHPGWRLGYAALHDTSGKMKEVTETMKKIASLYGHGTGCIPSPIIYAAAKAFRYGPFDAGLELIKKAQEARDVSLNCIDDIDGVSCVKPTGGLFMFPKVDAIGKGKNWEDDEQFQIDFLKEEAAMGMFGSRYGPSGYGHFRSLLLLHPELCIEFFNRLNRFLTNNTRN